MPQSLSRRKKAFAIAVVLSALSLLLVLDFHTLRKQSDSGYHNGVMEVREYRGDMGVFTVVYSKMRDASEANALLAARSHLYGVEDGDNVDSETQPDKEEVGREVKAPDPEKDETKTPVVSEETKVAPVVAMKFRPLVRPHRDEFEEDSMFEEKRTEENTEEKKSPEERLDFQDTNLFRPLQHNTASSPPVPSEPTQQIQVVPKHVFNSSGPITNAKQQKTAIKKLLQIESAEALWNLTQNQQLSLEENKKSLQHLVTNTYKKHKTRDQFRVQSTMSWPVPQFTKTDILQEKWVEDLKEYLQEITEWRQVSVVTANQEHQEVVLNWLSSAVTVAEMSPRNILVLSLSPTLHSLLISKKVNSIYVPPSSVINHAGLKRITSAFNQIHIVRLTFFRLMSHWAYDVVMYDSDAVVLKNPQPLFDANARVELVGSAGKGPDSIGHVWGRTICTGVLLMRSSPGLEIWWEKMSKVARLPFTDQGLVNIALKSLHIQWDQVSPLRVDQDMHGSCKNTKLEAVILSEEKICRYHCDSHKREQYYVWHKPAIKRNRTVENKKQKARDGGAWILRDDWAQISKMTSLTGVTWLLSIAQNS